MSIAVYTVPEALKEPQRASHSSHIIRKQNTYDDDDDDDDDSKMGLCGFLSLCSV